MPVKGVAIKVPILVWDFDNNCGKTGQSANLTLLGLGDATEYTPSVPDITEIDTTSRKGEYLISLTTAENNYDVNSIGGNLTTPVTDCVVIPTKWVNEQGVASIEAKIDIIDTNIDALKPDMEFHSHYPNL